MNEQNTKTEVSTIEKALLSIQKTIEEEKKTKVYSDEEKLRAAYALNLCTVSVSQIVDYEDSNILDQEYDTILNNLNIQNMPKDDALLDILKQILDTVTFFRIAKKERQLVDLEYQQKMKDAIWKAVPQFNIFVGQNPITAALSIAATLGSSYLNYRNAKAQNNLEYMKKQWQLERAAIEQLNGLRRELFNTAWRLEEKYNYPEAYRLTESQIAQYDEILMDTDLLRRYDRLDAIKQNFVAYLPFWYYLGNTADLISKDDDFSAETRIKYKQRALDAFGKYKNKLNLNSEELGSKNAKTENRLLREDHITAMWAIEYLTLLDLDRDSDRKLGKDLVRLAVENAGCSHDIQEFCVFAYLKIGDAESAQRILRQLINEGYNSVMNAQILSEMYAQRLFKASDWREVEAIQSEYEVLSRRVDSRYLYPIPRKNLESVNPIELNEKFLTKQKEIVFRNTQKIIRELIDKYTISYNRLIPVTLSEGEREYNDSYFTDTREARKRRLNDIAVLIAKPQKGYAYVDELGERFNSYNIVQVFNAMLNSLEKLSIFDEDDKANLRQSLKDGISSQREIYLKIEKAFSERNINAELLNDLFKISFHNMTSLFVEKLMQIVGMKIVNAKSMKDLSKIEGSLMNLCVNEKLSYPEAVPARKDDCKKNDVEGELPYNLLSDNVSFQKEKKAKENQINTCREYKAKGKLGLKQIPKKPEIRFLVNGEPEFDEYLAKGNMLGRKNDIIAILDDTSAFGIGSNRDIVFMTNGIYFINDWLYGSNLYPYKYLRLESNVIIATTDGHSDETRYNKGDLINNTALFELFRILNKQRADYVEENQIEDEILTYPALDIHTKLNFHSTAEQSLIY